MTGGDIYTLLATRDHIGVYDLLRNEAEGEGGSSLINSLIIVQILDHFMRKIYLNEMVQLRWDRKYDPQIALQSQAQLKLSFQRA